MDEALGLGSFSTLPDWLVTQTGLQVLCINVLTVVVLVLANHIYGEKQRREDYAAQVTVLHSASEEEKLRILSRVEMVSDNFKRQEELQEGNIRLKAKVDQQEIEMKGLRSKTETLQCTLTKTTKGLNDCRSRCLALRSELREMDVQMEEKNRTISEMKKDISDKDMKLQDLKKTMLKKEHIAKTTMKELHRQLSEREKEKIQMAEKEEGRIHSIQKEL